MHHGPWTQQVEVDHEKYIHLVCKLESRVHGGHNFDCNVVVTFRHVSLFFFAKCRCGH